ncbi:magnesium-translocating P-type ATPase [Streptomyces sp. TLI_185]|uniref:magnesium-translocating P-type ATPase n=1 Tax=Streptomyces sp. TLI_185 TaxID=2485151 RepID=UPI000F4E9B96|nr:magnesium-translocating P-type ATPase [Streptomyces sp. TLI_185]RPF33627.1 Mg2+-importing ATPase [Streptomyces sp. TLI_185]
MADTTAAPEPDPGALDCAGGPVPVADAGQGPGPTTLLQTLRRLGSGPRGLTEAQAEERQARFGANALPTHRDASWPRVLLHSLRDPFTAVLLCLGLVSAAVASWGTACVILLLVAVSCVLRASGEHRAGRSMAALRGLVATTATVLRRTGEDLPPDTREIPVDELVPGDVIRLGPGDLVPADVRLLRAQGLTVHQAALTGESAPVAKDAADTAGGAGGGLFDRPQLCFQGSSVASGSATAVVVATGARTRFAAANARSDVRPEASAFDRSVHGVSWILIRFMLLTPPLVLMANAALRDRGLETLPFAVAVAVGLTPEMLPVIVTMCLARGASLLARSHGVIVKRLPALHDLGAVDVLCLDKTGTLTEDRPVLDRALGPDGRDDPEVLRWAALNAWWTLQLADLPAPDALDDAVLDAADEDDVMVYDGVAALPFDPLRRLATAVVRTPGRMGTHTLVVKGAAEAVLERCVLEDDERGELLALAARHADDGLRVLAVATADLPHSRLRSSGGTPIARTREYTAADERGLDFRGFVTFKDALAPTAAEALKALADRGVTVRILTGDHPGTAVRACRDLGIAVPQDGVLTADGIDGLTDAELAAAAARTVVLARCTPEHKARFAAALRAGGHTVGYFGDGVNDLPALRAADVGIAPRDAVAVVRESADVVLADKDLTAIDHSIAAGRYSGGNIATYLRITLSSNLGNVIAMLAAGLLLPFLPMLPAQVLAQNLCFDAAQLAFAHDRPHPSVLRRPTLLRPRDLLRFIIGFGVLNAVADLATFGVLELALHGPEGLDDQAVFHSGWFTENLLTQALVMVLLRAGRLAAGRGPGPIGWAAGALAAVGLLLPVSPLGSLLGLTPLPLLYYLLLAAVLALYTVGLMAVGRAPWLYSCAT